MFNCVIANMSKQIQILYFSQTGFGGCDGLGGIGGFNGLDGFGGFSGFDGFGGFVFYAHLDLLGHF